MNYTKIINRINKAIENLEQNDFVSNIPNTIEDLYYMYFYLPKDKNKLNIKDQFIHGIDIESKLMEYFSKLTQKYINTKYNININIESSNEYSMAQASGGYDSKSDKIKYSSFGMTINRKNHSSYLQTFLHECRHKLQHDIYKSTNIEKILNFSSNSILLLKEEIYEILHTTNNREFYKYNYNNLYIETDAEKFSIDTVSNLVMDLYFDYIEYATTNKIKIDDSICDKVIEIHAKMQEDADEIKRENEQYGRLNLNIITELFSREPVSTYYKVGDKTTDKLIELDKTIKNNPQLQEQLPLLKLLFNGNTPKTYNEIIEDKERLLLMNPKYQNRINKFYNDIIKTDPMLYLTELVLKNELDLLKVFLEKHPTLFLEYPEEINYISALTENETVHILLTSNNNKKR